MQVENATEMVVGHTLGMDPYAREYVVVVVKGTFAIPTEDGAPAELEDEQVPIVEADVFTGEPGRSATIYESEYVLRKPRCDVLLNGSAYAPRGRPTDRVRVELRLATISKSFDVVGDRKWRRGVISARPGSPKPFEVMPISYDRAFGGVDDSNPRKTAVYFANPVGVGFHKRRKRGEVVVAFPFRTP